MAWKPNVPRKPYVYHENLFTWPLGFFEAHTAEELGLTEDERQELVDMQAQRIAELEAEHGEPWTRLYDRNDWAHLYAEDVKVEDEQ